jgi:hypothetical protein
LYEDTRDRHNQELANAIVVDIDAADNSVKGQSAVLTQGATTQVGLLFKKVDTSIGVTQEAAFESGKWGVDGALYVDGYTYIYGANPGDNPERVEQQVIAEMNGALCA